MYLHSAFICHEELCISLLVWGNVHIVAILGPLGIHPTMVRLDNSSWNKESILYLQVLQFHKQGQDPVQQFSLGKFSVNATDLDEILSEGGPTGTSNAYVREVRLNN